jgi:hypothetical protein
MDKAGKFPGVDEESWAEGLALKEQTVQLVGGDDFPVVLIVDVAPPQAADEPW